MKQSLTEILRIILEEDSLLQIKANIQEVLVQLTNKRIETDEKDCIYIREELKQIFESKTIERTKYYIKRLVKALEVERKGKINDLNLNRWKEYKDVKTDSLWIFDKRDNAGVHNAGYWGNFIPQIPNQLLRRYTRKGEWVLDPFAGMGTTLIECKRLGRNGIGIDINPDITKQAHLLIEKESNEYDVVTKLFTENALKIDYQLALTEIGIDKVQLIIMHPPYWDIIKFGNDPEDFSNTNSIEEFNEKMGKLIDITYPILDKKRYLAIVIGDKYHKGEWIPLGFYLMQEALKRKYSLKSVIVKNFDTTRAKLTQQELWRYRALVGGFYVFKHEYIFLFQKK
jgi:DNA modification methylase